MSYRIKNGEGLAVAFGRIAAEQIDLATAQLGRSHHGEAIHNARKALKRLRALLRLMRVALPKRLFRQENRRLAEAGRKISPLRDIHVQLCMLEKIKADATPAGSRLRRHLLRQESFFMRRVPALRKTLRAMLDQSRRNLVSPPLREPAPKDLADSLKRIYKRGRSALKAARRSPTPVHLHDWRKKAKPLGYSLELIQDLGPHKLSKMIRHSDALTDLLGDDHDLFMIWSALEKEHRSRPTGNLSPLAGRISRQRKKLQKRAIKLGQKIYDEKPGAFEKRLGHYLH